MFVCPQIKSGDFLNCGCSQGNGSSDCRAGIFTNSKKKKKKAGAFKAVQERMSDPFRRSLSHIAILAQTGQDSNILFMFHHVIIESFLIA